MAEIDEQIAVVTWCDIQGIPIWHNVNEGQRSFAAARQLIAAGLRRGVPDLFIPQARNGYHGMFIEMKSEKGTLTPDQRAWLRDLRSWGYHAGVAYSFEEAKRAIEKYMKETDENGER